MGLSEIYYPEKGYDSADNYTDFRELNKRIVRRPYPIPKISTTLQELEGFTNAMALDLNMGYYTIRLDPKRSRCSPSYFHGASIHT
jgi:hypothetical protein